MKRSLGITLLLLALAPWPARAQSSTYLDRDFGKEGATVEKVLMLPLDVEVYEMSAGGVIEKVPDWSLQARAHVQNALRTLAPRAKFEIIPAPALNEEETALLEQHVAQFDLIARSLRMNNAAGGPLWKDRVAAGRADYSIGNGLAFLAERTGADKAVIVSIHDLVTSGERKAMFVVGLLFGVAMPLGQTLATAGLVDLKSGRVLWQAFDFSGSPDTRKAEDADKVVRDLFGSFPNNPRPQP
jgi:hypothetical protein